MSADLEPGTMLSQAYRIGVLVGRGGMGSVYEAHRIADGTRVAIKVLLPNVASDPDVVMRFEREAHAASHLGHPNIVRVLDFRRTPGEPVFLVMEFLEGHSLKDEIESEGTLSPGRVARIAYEVLSALAVAHRANIVHRDVKPDNLVLLTARGGPVVKVVDFGVAKVFGAEALTRAGQIVGTPAYMSPEQWHGRAVDARADLYALGGCMIHALTGSPAISSIANALTPGFAASRALDTPKLRAEISASFAHVIAKALAEEPRDRYSSADEMAEALKPFVPSGTLAMPSFHPAATQQISQPPRASQGTNPPRAFPSTPPFTPSQNAPPAPPPMRPPMPTPPAMITGAGSMAPQMSRNRSLKRDLFTAAIMVLVVGALMWRACGAAAFRGCGLQ